jgi:hypothetical protein
LKTSAAAVPYRKKSYHSIVVPTKLAMTTRRVFFGHGDAAVMRMKAERGRAGAAGSSGEAAEMRTALDGLHADDFNANGRK